MASLRQCRHLLLLCAVLSPLWTLLQSQPLPRDFTSGRNRPRARVRRYSGRVAPERGQCDNRVLQQFKSHQKTNHTQIDWPWSRYCAEEANGVMDPSRHPTDSVQNFLEQWERGDFEFERATPEKLAKLATYKKCAKVQRNWMSYCLRRKNCFGVLDPAALPSDEVEHFLEHYCQEDLPKWMVKPNQTATKELIGRLTFLRKRYPFARWVWARYCEENAHGCRTPSQLPNEVVKAFLADWDSGKFRHKRPDADLLQALQEKMLNSKVRRQWNWYVGQKKACYGERSPQALPASYIEEFLSTYCSSFDMESERVFL